MQKTLFRNALGDTPTIRILEVFLEGENLDYCLTDIAEQAQVSWTTLHRVWPGLLKTRLVKQTRTIGRAKMYKLNKNSPAVLQLSAFFNTLLKESRKSLVH